MRTHDLNMYTLHVDETDFRIFKCGVLARNPKEAASILGGEYIEPNGGIKQVATDPEELHFVGFVKFDQALFREMTHSEREVAGIFAGRKCYVKWPFTLLASHDGQPVMLAMREHPILLPEYISIPPQSY